MRRRPSVEEHELPSLEAVLAGTLALMTGYSQALQAELDPGQRLRMGLKIGDNLALLVEHPLLSPGFRQVALGLRHRWLAMSDCTALAAHDCACVGSVSGVRPLPAPKRLQ
jgi:hypothetical protein